MTGKSGAVFVGKHCGSAGHVCEPHRVKAADICEMPAADQGCVFKECYRFWALSILDQDWLGANGHGAMSYAKCVAVQCTVLHELRANRVIRGGAGSVGASSIGIPDDQSLISTGTAEFA